MDAGLEGFSENFPKIVGTLANELEPDAEFYIMTMYNPFNFGLGIPSEASKDGFESGSGSNFEVSQ